MIIVAALGIMLQIGFVVWALGQVQGELKRIADALESAAKARSEKR